MATNPFDAEDGGHLVLVNAEGQHCLWPALADVPVGWTAAHGPAGRGECLDYVNAHWTDLRPQSVAAYLAGQTN